MATTPPPARRIAPTLEAVAERAGVSRATASRVLNGATNVSQSAREAVERASAELDYTPNLAARSLVTRRSDSVAFVVSESEDRFFDDPFFAGLLRGAHSVVAEQGIQLVFVIKSSDADARRFINYAAGGHIDGAMLVSLHGDDPLPNRLVSLGIPTVVNGRPLGDWTGHYVDADNRGGGRMATDVLVERGSRVIATITGPRDMNASRDRLAGFRDSLKAAGIKSDRKAVVEGDYSLQGGFDAMQRLLKAVPNVDGVFVGNDLMGVGAIQALERVGRRVPHDVAIVGFDDVPAAVLSNPPLTTVRQPIELMGQQMARMLIDLIESRPVPAALILPTSLVRRESA